VVPTCQCQCDTIDGTSRTMYGLGCNTYSFYHLIRLIICAKMTSSKDVSVPRNFGKSLFNKPLLLAYAMVVFAVFATIYLYSVCVDCDADS